MAKLLEKVRDFIKLKELIQPNDQLLVAVSGGLDSMFLVNYLINANYNVAVAHCNFELRGDESAGDEQFIKTFCEAKKIRCYVKRFETENYAKTHGISIQMAARDLRYEWFNTLCQNEHYTKIVTAHHKTDNAETILLNMVRGTGLKGLEGIKPITRNIIRPLLCLSRDEIAEAAKKLNIAYREDSSNLGDKYYRNRIRHHVLPKLKTINPSVEDTFERNADIAAQANRFINQIMETIKKEIIIEDKNLIKINIKLWLNQPEPKFVLYHIIDGYGFTKSVSDDIFQSVNSLSGKQFYSQTHKLIKDRDYFILEPFVAMDFQIYEVFEETKSILSSHHHWNFDILNKYPKQIGAKNEAFLDFKKLNFPLTIRLWQHGDKLQPLGNIGHKKVSDLLIDKKISVIEKEKIWVVISGEDIVWVSNVAVNEKYKLNPDTLKCFKISIH